jgi:SAM-dependent methyltransferase
MDLVIALKPTSVLDIGAGYGKYGVLCREYLELWDGRQNYNDRIRRIDGIEVFENYITPLHEFVYDHIYVGDVLKVIDKLDVHYDLVLLVDVLEHFIKSNGESLLHKLLKENRGVIISTPRRPTAQKDAFGNAYETHKSRWTKRELSGLGSSYFVRDRISFIGYIGKKEHVQKLKRELVLMNIKKYPNVSFLIEAWKYYSRKYVKKPLAEKIMNKK